MGESKIRCLGNLNLYGVALTAIQSRSPNYNQNLGFVHENISSDHRTSRSCSSGCIEVCIVEREIRRYAWLGNLEVKHSLLRSLAVQIITKTLVSCTRLSAQIIARLGAVLLVV
jgi:hypothetical protein